MSIPKVNSTIDLPTLLGVMIGGVLVEARVINTLGIQLGHWLYPQPYEGTVPPISPLDPLVGIVLLSALALGVVLYRKYRSTALGLIFSVPITWGFIALAH